MESPLHALKDLFDQLGLPSSGREIDRFVAQHRPLPGDVALADAPFWSAAQARFLREEVAEDADWAELVDHLDAMLRA
ncbi:MAG: DUF2789 domain-containing protein [Piscinibacter sp.]|nr:DUF2789 domain-containing protein [Piscinibacter sp.]